jgi:hypothetical protein
LFLFHNYYIPYFTKPVHGLPLAIHSHGQGIDRRTASRVRLSAGQQAILLPTKARRARTFRFHRIPKNTGMVKYAFCAFRLQASAPQISGSGRMPHRAMARLPAYFADESARDGLLRLACELHLGSRLHASHRRDLCDGSFCVRLDGNIACCGGVFYCQPIFIWRRLPRARAARSRVWRVTAWLAGFKSRSRAARLVFMRRDISVLDKFCSCLIRST